MGQVQRWRSVSWIAAGIFAVLALDAARVETPTVDEFAHVPAGLAYWEHGRFDLYARNTPPFKQVMALPLLLGGAHAPEPDVPRFSGWGPWAYGAAFQEANGERYLGWFWFARTFPVVAVLLTGALLNLWAQRLFHARAAAIATSLFFLSPTVLAHGHLATTDAACMFTLFATAWLLRWACAAPSPLRMAAVGVAWGIALLVKFTAVLLAPAVLVLVILHRRAAWRRGLLDLATISAVALVCVNAGMGFRGSFQPLGDFVFASNLANTTQRVLPAGLPVPVPEAYAVGFDAQLRDTESGELGSYLLGSWSQRGRWHHGPVALAVKTPLPILALWLASPWFLRRHPLARAELWHVLAPLISLAVLLLAFNRLGIGVRHLLPTLPFLFLLSASVWPRRKGWKLPAGLLAYALLTAAWIHPSHLGFFNGFAGGPRSGHRVLADSDLDWGQDLYQLPAALEALSPDGPIYLLYFGHVDPALYGIDHRVVPDEPVEGVVAVSANYWLGAEYPVTAPDGGMRRIRRGHLDWLRGREPVARAGSIWIFDTRRERTPGL
jgi:hypothetical protein